MKTNTKLQEFLEEKQPQKYVTLGIRRRSVGGCGLSVVVVATAKVNGQMELEECFFAVGSNIEKNSSSEIETKIGERGKKDPFETKLSLTWQKYRMFSFSKEEI